MKKTFLITLVFCFCASSVFAQNDTAALEQKLKDMEERIIALEGQVRQLKTERAAGAPAAKGETAPAPVEASAQPQPTATTSAGEPSITPPLGGASNAGKALNPDISVIGDFLGAVGRNPINPTPSMEMHESEVGLQAIIDPYARGDFFIS